MPYTSFRYYASKDKCSIREYYERMPCPIMLDNKKLKDSVRNIVDFHYSRKEALNTILKNKKIKSENLRIDIKGHSEDVHKLMIFLEKYFDGMICDTNGKTI